MGLRYATLIVLCGSMFTVTGCGPSLDDQIEDLIAREEAHCRSKASSMYKVISETSGQENASCIANAHARRQRYADGITQEQLAAERQRIRFISLVSNSPREKSIAADERCRQLEPGSPEVMQCLLEAQRIGEQESDEYMAAMGVDMKAVESVW